MKFGALIKEINTIIEGAFIASGIFLIIFMILYALGIKALDLWLLAGLSIAYGASRIIFRSPSIDSFITNKANIWLSSIIVSFLVITGLSFAVVFLTVTMLAELNVYEVNPLLDVSVSLLISALILTLLISLLKMRKQPRENSL